MTISVALKWRVRRGRLLLAIGSGPERIVGRIECCPSCGSPVFVEA